MSDHGSTYSVLQNVPVMVSPHYRLPKKIVIASELKPVPNDLSQVVAHSFSIERQVIAHVEASRKRSADEEEALRIRRAQYEQEKDNQRKVAARKIAPGFLDTDTRILKPELKHSYVIEESVVQESPKPLVAETSVEKQFDYHKFEQGLAPADPWDTPENDFTALRSVLSSPRMNYSNSHISPPTYTQYPARPYTKNEGAYWNFQNGATTYPQGLSPAIPPKLFNSPSPSSSTSLPILSPAPPPVPPPLPEYLIEELNNMGFTRAQATDALEKNEHDLMKATNFLLDQA